MTNHNANDWLPSLVTMADYGGKWEDYLETIYDIFQRDFVRSKPRYAAKRFALKRHPVSEGKEATFWHLVSEGRDENNRTVDIRRCERIRWPRPLIEAIGSDKVCVWRNKRGNSNRIVIAIDDFSYIVILDDRKDYVLLWTAYFVERERRRRKLEREYETWKAARK